MDLLFVFTAAGLVILQWREGGSADLTWALWHALLQSGFVVWVAAASLAQGRIDLRREAAAFGALAACAFLSTGAGAALSAGHFILLEGMVLIGFVALVSAALAIRRLSWPGRAAFAAIVVIFAAGILGSLRPAPMYLTPIPPALEIFSWVSSIAQESRVQRILFGTVLSRLDLALMIQLFMLTLSTTLLYRLPRAPKGSAQGKT